MTGSQDTNLECVLWRRLDTAGHECGRVYGDDDGWYLDGVAIFSHEGQPVRLEYLVECNVDWETTAVHIDGWVGDEMIEIEIEATQDGVWTINGTEVEVVEGCKDIDLNFSPITNTLPICRLDLKVGESQKVRAAWLRFPSFDLVPLDQTYTRINADAIKYESSTGFTAELKINEIGLVIDYPNLWTVER